MKIKFLKAFNGDAVWLSFKENKINRNILIDGGMPASFVGKDKKTGKQANGDLYDAIDEIRGADQKIDLLILTHVDDDHIGGVLKWISKDQNAAGLIKEVWFNSGRLISEYFSDLEESENLIDIPSETLTTSIGQGVKFEDFITTNKIWHRQLIKAGDHIERFGLCFEILSPDLKKLEKLRGKWAKEKPWLGTSGDDHDYAISLKEHIQNDVFSEDNTVHNGSSIAFLLYKGNKKMLFLADAHPSVITSSLLELGYHESRPLPCELVKVSHHGSQANSSPALIKSISAELYVISTNGDRHAHPNKQFLARLIGIRPDCKLAFNYPKRGEKIFSDQDRIDFPDFQIEDMDDNSITLPW